MPAWLLNRTARGNGEEVMAGRIMALLPMLSVKGLQDLQDAIRAELGHAAAEPTASTFNLTFEELQLLRFFRDIPDDERREAVLAALEAFGSVYA